jgi:sarcosine dehydrogenase
VDARSHEAYAKNYSMVFVHDEPLAGRNMKRDPLHEVRISFSDYFRDPDPVILNF